MSNALVQVNKVFKYFKSLDKEDTYLKILENVTFEIEKSKITVLKGSSGVGKSTLLNILGSLDQPDKGEILFNGTNSLQLNEDDLMGFRNKQLGFVFQFHHLLSEFTALENTIMPLIIGGTTQAKANDMGSAILERVGLKERLNHRPRELSGGEQQRVALARAMVHKPQLVLADEPSGNLDDGNTRSFFNLIKELSQDNGITFFIVTHDKQIADYSDLVFELQNGQIQKV